MQHNQYIASVGDWVYSNSPGIWQVYRVVGNVYYPRSSLHDRQRRDRHRLVLCKRFLDKSWQEAFTQEVASQVSATPISAVDRVQLDAYIGEHPEVWSRFEAFKPDSVDHVLNIRLNIPPSMQSGTLAPLLADVFIGIESGLTNDELLELLESSPLVRYRTRGMSNASLQFVCCDYEVRDNQYVYRDVRVV